MMASNSRSNPNYPTVSESIPAECLVVASKGRPRLKTKPFKRHTTKTELKLAYAAYFDGFISPRNKVLHLCNQKNIESFEEAYDWANLQTCRKIDKGLYCHVFDVKFKGRKRSVLKVIPVEGNTGIYQQQTFQDLLIELIAGKSVSTLASDKINMAHAFSALYSVKCVHGPIPNKLARPWEEWDNVCPYCPHCVSPSAFPPEQVYIVIEMDYCGIKIRQFEFKYAEEVESAFQQITCALAVAEKAFEFEHRDLKHENILVTRTTIVHLPFILDEKKFTIPSNGVIANIVDFGCSRMSTPKGTIYYDFPINFPMFAAEGHYLYAVYRQMKANLWTCWNLHYPKSNIFWLRYFAKLCINELGDSVRAWAVKLFLSFTDENYMLVDSAIQLHTRFMKNDLKLKDMHLGRVSKNKKRIVLNTSAHSGKFDRLHRNNVFYFRA